MTHDHQFDSYVKEAEDHRLRGWDWSYIGDRISNDEPKTWDYKTEVLKLLDSVNSMLDLGTGGGEFLASLGQLPKETIATEAYSPNVAIAKSRLDPLGVTVLEETEEDVIPLNDNQVELIIDRHTGFRGTEIARVLKPGGIFITQQVGGSNMIELNELLEGPAPEYASWDELSAAKQLVEAGMVIKQKMVEHPITEFKDIGAVIFYLNSVPWQIPGLNTPDNIDRLYELHKQILATGPIKAHAHRFFMIAMK